jgi:hypothetical protein
MADGFYDIYVATRRQFRGVAESLIAGPQYRAAGTIRLAVRPDGFAGVSVPLAVHGTQLTWPNGAATLTGDLNTLVAAAGDDAGPPDGAYEIVDPRLPDAASTSTRKRRPGSTGVTTQAGMRSSTSCLTSIPCSGLSISTSRSLTAT